MTDLTPWERKALTLLERAALAERPCPTNDDVADWLRCSHAKAAGVVAALDTSGVIRIHRHANRRVIEIVATGRRTALTAKRLRLHDALHDSSPKRPLAVLHYHTGCSWCGCRVDVCSCRDGKAARGEMAA
ncbi:hypothetical protein [Croceicoccus sp. BE223]|uniref:hypothetical protein n=1 Tax=Croceicoccus sp. BE223 TaxID=2817716 RepID=UPI002859015A|nr:hypothetical protein [Croceicoccus sp. BE223]MDR7101504.1 hypothetical protein [Croceicoccus sp. BE223]